MQFHNHIMFEHTWMALAALWRNSSSGSVGSNSGSSPSSNVSPSSRASASSTCACTTEGSPGAAPQSSGYASSIVGQVSTA
jgi:hypothetical protein